MKKLSVVGLGPGQPEWMTYASRAALEAADVLVGYTKYIELVAPLYPEKPTYTTPMKREIDRCREALSLADGGKSVALVCSGDAGVYGMAGPICELSPEFPEVEIEIFPGVTAALSGAAVLGAPLTHDFAVISLSDLLTPWDLIEKRLDCAAQADFCIALYNPSSIKRSDYLRRACEILMRHKSPETLCGWVRNIGREGQQSGALTLCELRDFQADMFTTVFIGNEKTRLVAGRLATPRGYRLE